jgi:non-heme chloroperoxidase
MFHHGWPLSADDWDNQMLFFLSHGYRVIAHDRRGHGRSDLQALFPYIDFQFKK